MARRDDSWVVVSVIAGILLAMRDSKTIEWGSGWVWPIPEIVFQNGRALPVISQEWRPGAVPHYGVDLMYRNPAAPPTFYVPAGEVPVVAARAGTLWSVDRTPRGWAVVIDHGKPFATFYQHLSSVDFAIANGRQGRSRKPTDPAALPVAAGQRLGVMGADPLDPAHVRHLHFAVWYQGSGDAASVDPSAPMTTWGRVQWTA